MNKVFSIKDRIRSFRFAMHGLRMMLQSQHNAWLHATATVLVITGGIVCHINHDDWCWIVLAVISVWTAEALNTALEFIADVASPEFHPLVKSAKDVAAAAVMLSALGALIIGLLVLGPPLWQLIRS
ncbi:MAG: diacylglycerol kinase family protein [Phycisphaerae bacterium]|nr:diacylglycerol kinase family protein [Phycisphaerae bacterium]